MIAVQKDLQEAMKAATPAQGFKQQGSVEHYAGKHVTLLAEKPAFRQVRR
jgi:hypothetical protein